ncbi:hypothetical protein CYMTET_4515 [Cymbomonas tetramitiformis]|uniref:IBR domain-containing protein n=1 Tax=Cymbomonas tetramitiformis TaxID=36881 RepID=A0AAE0EWV6_9CHLO|nr:hypothetical protein CYMTET_47254 [Cymbomonas tetramitiformis]KAK3246148.1 hypothetical protein CYMTET_44290 [Cymbomonas tetramitiformis]KAK3252080.1 hypothetical protein CYMTET_38638 [Cymbomonas tetramitiformis]KAK3287961.1 hypothetical protein CYMTET_4515 [Cymbomonas tetramitiformis]
MPPKRCRSLSPSMLRCSTPCDIQTAPRRDRYSSPEPTPRSSPTSPPGAPKKKPRHEAQARGLSTRYALDRRFVYASDGSVTSDSPVLAARRNDMIKLCLDFGSWTEWDRSSSARQEGTRRRIGLRRHECPGCHLIETNLLQERSDSCMALRCEQCKNVFCGFCLLFSGNAAEVSSHAAYRCLQNPNRPLLRLPDSISLEMRFERMRIIGRMREAPVHTELSRGRSAERQPERVSDA